ncbi:tetratricopeptide repeat protein [Paraneptunicella aestuarii]|uniref:tetratricopeptide repeat protein n=1 Tax=Paraneptunicella aestuarii TaxID=2831148 RepID=UPI001E640EA2|nr:tetratricopeptide repeat protein [Paraneptunicella aestuarii]UAA37578.1 tetratricopeptide repeat protein [Paraneptunicella aestuarii]
MEENQLFIQISDTLSQGKLDVAAQMAEEAIVQFPQSAQLYFISAAISAQSELYEEAINRYNLALELNPQLHIANFQLGLLLATLGQIEPSIEVLTRLSEDAIIYLNRFAKGLILVLTAENNQKKLTQALEFIQEGIRLNQENLYLNDDMRGIAERIENELSTMPDMQLATNEETDESDQSHLLDIYQNKH